MAKREVCPTCKGCGHVIVLNWPEKCPKCKATGFVKAQQTPPAGVSGNGGEVFRGQPPMEPQPSDLDRSNALLRQAREALDDLKTAHWEHWPWQDIDLANAAIAAIDAAKEPK